MKSLLREGWDGLGRKNGRQVLGLQGPGHRRTAEAPLHASKGSKGPGRVGVGPARLLFLPKLCGDLCSVWVLLGDHESMG